MADSTTVTTFSFTKRDFLHSKLDEVLRLWHRGSGQGSFTFNINDGDPTFQFGLHLDFEDGSGSEPTHHQTQPQQHHSGPPRHVVRRRGPAKQAKNRQRAAEYQAAKAAKEAAPASSAYKFPGEGKPVGTASGPTLPLPLSKGASFPPPTTHTPVCSIPASTVPTTVAAPAAPHPRRTTPFPGTGHPVGTADRPVLRLPLRKEDVFPPPSDTASISLVTASPPLTLQPAVTSSVTPSSTSSLSTSVTYSPSMNLPAVSSSLPPISTLATLTTPVAPSVSRMPTVAINCAVCWQPIDGRAKPVQCKCGATYHKKCSSRHPSCQPLASRFVL